MISLENKIAVVTGSTSGIGQGIAEYFARLGAKVMVSGRDLERGVRTLDQIKKFSEDADFYEADLSIASHCTQLIKYTVERFGGIDILVNNAADTSRGSIEDTPIELWDRIMKTNLRAPFLCIQAAIEPMTQRGGGSVVNIGSVNAYIGEPKLFAYSVSKGGLMTLTKNAASQLARRKIRVNCINVGWTLTEGERKVKAKEGKDEEWIDEAVKTRPFGRLLYPQDIANAAAYFASSESECVTGSVMDLEQYPVGAPPNF